MSFINRLFGSKKVTLPPDREFVGLFVFEQSRAPGLSHEHLRKHAEASVLKAISETIDPDGG